MLLFYLRTSFRSIRRNPLFAGLNIAGLGIGICVFLFAMEYYSFETGFNRFHTRLPQLYRVNITSKDGQSAVTFPALGPFMQKAIPGVKAAIRFGDNFNSGAILSYRPTNDRSAIKSFQEEGCVFADPALLDAFSWPLLAGSNQLATTNTALITAQLASRLFGSEPAVGKTIQFHNQFGDLPVTVTGVLKDIPVQSDIRFSCLLSMQILQNPGYTEGSDWAKPDSWDNQAYTTFAWLEPGADPAEVAARASDIWRRHDPNYKTDKGSIVLQPLASIHLGGGAHDNSPAYGSLTMTRFILALGILVCAIGWINYINFSTAVAISQAKPIGIHKIVGSSNRRIIFRYMTEAMLLNGLALLLAVLMAVALQPLVYYFTGRPISFDVIRHPLTLACCGAVLVAGTLLCGGYVGWQLSIFKPVSMMRFNDATNTGGLWLRKGLVVFQFFIAAVFIAATLIAYRQIDFLRHHDLGMRIDNLVVIKGPEIRDSSYKKNKVLFRDQLARFAFVEKISTTGSIPGEGLTHNFDADGVTGSAPQKGDERKSYSISEVDEHYFDTYRIPILGGSDFSSEDADKNYKGNRLIVNETAARQLGYDPRTAAGRILNWDKPYTIAGVVRDYNHQSLKQRIEPIIYVPMHNNHFYTLKMNPTRLPDKLALIQTLFAKMYPGNPFEYTVLKDTYDHLYENDQRSAGIALSLSVLVVAISCLGLIGLSIFTTRRRKKEIGIRKVLGAGVGTLFALLSGEFIGLVIIAFLIAIPVTWLCMNKWLEGFAYRVAIPWWIFGLTGAAAVLIALVTVSVQSLRSAFVNPIDSLRSE